MALGKHFTDTTSERKSNIMSIAAAAAGGIAAAAYLDGKYQLRRELNYIRKLKKAEKAYAKACMTPTTPLHSIILI